MSPGIAGFQTPVVPKRQELGAPTNEKILSLVTTLSERVRHLESKLDGLEPRKRSATDESIDPSPGALISRPSKQPRISQSEIPEIVSNRREDELVLAEVESISGQNSSDEAQEVEDAATVLEFLAWGRLKDSNLTSGLRDTSAAHENALYPDKDIIQTTQAWGLSPSSVSASHMTMETLQISQIQEMLPEKEQVMLLFEYHADWLLFMHCSFHARTFRRELEQFYKNDSGIISRTSSGLQWAALLFTIMCGSMTCAKPAQVIRWRFNQGVLSHYKKYGTLLSSVDDQGVFAKQWYHASIECLNTARYQQNHSCECLMY